MTTVGTALMTVVGLLLVGFLWYVIVRVVRAVFRIDSQSRVPRSERDRAAENDRKPPIAR